MTFLVWGDQQDAEASLAAVNAVYGCPYEAGNGYRMERWDTVIASRNATEWGFFKPEPRIGKDNNELDQALISGFDEKEGKPEEFYPEEVAPDDQDI